MLAPVCCSDCGCTTYYHASKLPERPLCPDCQQYAELRTRVDCEKCPAKTECEEAERRGL